MDERRDSIMMDNTVKKPATVSAKPILKWAGGKTQMLSELLPKVPASYGRYIEPFFGGGALLRNSRFKSMKRKIIVWEYV